MGELVAVNDLIVVKQLPVIEDRLDEALRMVRGRLQDTASLVVTDDNYKELKKVRAELNKELNDLETLRKRVKEAVEAPYKNFESGAYKRLADEYRGAIGTLDGEIKDVESGLRKQRQDEVAEFFDGYRKSLGIDAGVVDFGRSGIRVGLSGSIKSFKDQVKAYLERVDGDLKMIDTLDDRDEVLAEYRVCFSVTDAVRVVSDRHKRIEEMRVKREAEEEERKRREEHDAAVEAAVSVPTVEAVEEPVYATKYLGYEIRATLGQLKALKAFLTEELIKYLEKEGIEYGQC